MSSLNYLIRAIAFYLPQYHPIPENDEWWGKGFTEWTNVTKAKPLFKGHYQPHLPADLGFYDLRLPEARQAQADLAREYGIHGFCYYHYWFNGKRLLERPFNEVLASGKPDFPFCLCWANETWSRRWLGEERAILLKQTYSDEDTVNHAQWLAKAFSDPRYIKISGRPLFIIYKPLDLPDAKKTIECLKLECMKLGLPEPYIVGCNAHCANVDCKTIGCDHTLDFQPQLGRLHNAFEDGKPRFSRFQQNLKLNIFSSTLKVYDSQCARQIMCPTSYQQNISAYPTVFVSWDNTPRRGENAIILQNSTPKEFEKKLSEVVDKLLERQDLDDKIVFINAWNEWAEGNHLEPDLLNGKAYLEAVRQIIIKN
jgi:lipopolysaccharide biosynthesis protein